MTGLKRAKPGFELAQPMSSLNMEGWKCRISLYNRNEKAASVKFRVCIARGRIFYSWADYSNKPALWGLLRGQLFFLKRKNVSLSLKSNFRFETLLNQHLASLFGVHVIFSFLLKIKVEAFLASNLSFQSKRAGLRRKSCKTLLLS